MKKLVVIIVALIIIAVIVCVVAFGGNKDSNNNNNPQNVVDCKTTGEHIYEKGECKGCGLKVFDVIKEYCLEHGEKNYYNQAVIELGDYKTDQYYVRIYFEIDKNHITINCHKNLFHLYYINLEFSPYVFEDGEYEWSAGCGEFRCEDCPSISGYLDPSKFTSSTSCLTYTSSETNANDIAKEGTWTLQHCIEEYLIDFLKDVGSNITLKDLGFVRY